MTPSLTRSSRGPATDHRSPWRSKSSHGNRRRDRWARRLTALHDPKQTKKGRMMRKWTHFTVKNYIHLIGCTTLIIEAKSHVDKQTSQSMILIHAAYGKSCLQHSTNVYLGILDMPNLQNYCMAFSCVSQKPLVPQQKKNVASNEENPGLAWRGASKAAPGSSAADLPAVEGRSR